MRASLTDRGSSHATPESAPVIVGCALIVLDVGFFLFFLSTASRSNNPAEPMRTVGTVSGIAIGIAVAMVAAGLIGKKIL